MSRSLARSALAFARALLASTLSYAQGGSTSTLSGTVVDFAGGMVPGATVVVENNTSDNVNFDPGRTGNTVAAGTAASTFQATTASTDVNNTFDPGGRIDQLVFRLNW